MSVANLTDSLMQAVKEEVRASVMEAIAEERNPLMPEKDVLDWLGIKSWQTLGKWRAQGLTYYEPMRGKRYYFRKDVENFIKLNRYEGE